MVGMQGLKTGIILYVEKYEECVSFYREKIELPFLYDKEDLTCFKFGGSYLMVEIGGVFTAPDDRKENETTLRFDVDNFDETISFLKNKGIDVDVQIHEWGTVGEFFDPDGNRCSVKKGSRI